MLPTAPQAMLRPVFPARAQQKVPQVLTTSAGAVLCPRCRVAATPWTRLRGLLGRELGPDDGLLIRPTNSIHMFFMGYAIDAVFLDREQRVMKISHALAPWKVSACRGARSVVELPAGTCARVGLEVGHTVTATPVADERGGT